MSKKLLHIIVKTYTTKLAFRYVVMHTGQQGNDYGIYDSEGGSSPIACGMTEDTAMHIAALLNERMNDETLERT